jgi:hypothetical protein
VAAARVGPAAAGPAVEPCGAETGAAGFTATADADAADADAADADAADADAAGALAMVALLLVCAKAGAIASTGTMTTPNSVLSQRILDPFSVVVRVKVIPHRTFYVYLDALQSIRARASSATLR